MKTLTKKEVRDLIYGLNPKKNQMGKRIIQEPKFDAARTDVAAVAVSWGDDSVVFRTKCYLVYKNKKGVIQHRELRDVPKYISIEKVEIKDGYFGIDFKDKATCDLPLCRLELEE